MIRTAQVKVNNDITIASIKKFLGLNENPDGDTTLKIGEFTAMRNFRITQDRHLQIRPGSKTVISLADAIENAGGTFDEDDPTARVYGAWRGHIGGAEHNIVAYYGYLFDVDVSAATPTATIVGTSAKAETFFIGFNNKVYLLNGSEYKSWGGAANTTFADVEPYVPIVQTATTPGGDGTALESVNRLTPKKRVQFSPDGTAKDFFLPEQSITSVDEVKVNGSVVATGYTVTTATGKVAFTTAPTAGTNTVEITYSKGSSAADEVKHMKFAELYNGATDTRLFLYGDGTNRAIYSGVPYGTGQPSAEYFSAMAEVNVGETNTPITALVRHYDRLMAFKPNSAYVVTYSTLDLADSSTIAAFYVRPVNRQLGNDAPGQVHLLENNPLTLDVGSIYRWRSSGYSSYITSNENNAQRISDRVVTTLQSCDVENVKTANIKSSHEYWFFLGNGRALILNYANDAWYYYQGLPFRMLLEAEQELYGFCDDGDVVRFSNEYRNDRGAAIDCYAATGAMDFDRDWLLKYSPMLFVAMQPQANARIYVSVETNRRSDYPKKPVAYGLATFMHVDFNHFSFITNRKPKVSRLKIKVKKATYYRIIYESNSTTATGTILQTDVKLRYAGAVR